MDNEEATLSQLKADLLLLHPTAFFDFRNRRDVYFPFLSTSGNIPITPLYEQFPIGFKSLQRYLIKQGHSVKIINLSTIMLRYPRINIDNLLKAFNVKLIGIDLHWMIHVQGSLAIAKRIKEFHPHTPIIFGGISSTYYAEQLIHYSFIDMVMRGYDVHKPMNQLLLAIKEDAYLKRVPNLLWKSKEGEIIDNSFSFTHQTFGCGIDWESRIQEYNDKTLPISELISVYNTGCFHNCGWCGGAAESFRRINRCSHGYAKKSRGELFYEFNSIKNLKNIGNYHYYANSFYNESPKRAAFILDRVRKLNFKSVAYEQYYLPLDKIVKQMAQTSKNTIITLSPDSHDLAVAKASGRGVYNNEELEGWLEKAFKYGISQVDIWYFIGLPLQDEKSVMGTVDYCHRILKLFKSRKINPMICPMIPFLDPGSKFFEYPEQHGYHLFYRTVEEHRRAMEQASIINRVNYETKWLSRSDLVYTGFKAVRQLMELKGIEGFLPMSLVKQFNEKIDDALSFIPLVHKADCINDKLERSRELLKLGEGILQRNEMIFFSGVANQSFPVNRSIGGRWFDVTGWLHEELQSISEVSTIGSKSLILTKNNDEDGFL